MNDEHQVPQKCTVIPVCLQCTTHLQMQMMPSSPALSRWVDPTKLRQVTVPLWYSSSPLSARRLRSYRRMCSSAPPEASR